jgi:type VII secretion-associated serine protease mycosin
MPGRARWYRPAVLVVLAVLVLLAVLVPLGPPALAQPPAGQRCDLPVTGPVARRPWPQQRLDYERVWPLTRGAGVTVAVVDTGVDGAHPQLRGAVRPGIDVVNGGTADTDCVGHGTLVAGLMAARPAAGTGFAGVAPDATVLPVRVTNSQQGTAAPLAEGIRRAVDAGARVVNVSIVVDQSTPALRAAVDYAISRDVVVVAAAGNEFQSGSPLQYPAAYPGVLAVGAIDASGGRADFSETDAGVAVVAPGVDIVGPGAGGTGLVAGGQGTSYAAPFVSGTAALVRAYHPELSAPAVITRIERTADRPPASDLPDAALGWGTVNPYAAVTAVLPGSTSAPVAGQRVVVPAAAPPDTRNRDRARWYTGLALAAALVVTAVAAILPAARRRSWRPGRHA